MNTQLLITETRYKAINTIQTQYQSSVRSLIYAMLGTWPEIVYLVFVVSCYTFNS